jgi:peptide/nickel transport system permease protein
MHGWIREFPFQNKMHSQVSQYGNLRMKFASRKTIRVAGTVLVFFSLLALFGSVLCNEKPLYAKYKGMNLFPALSLKGYSDISSGTTQVPERLVYSTVNWRELQMEKVTWCPVIYSPGKSDWLNAGYKSPFDSQLTVENGNPSPATFRSRHLLGTTKTGADVLSGIVHGTRVSLTIGVFSMVIAGITGILLGAAAGFFGDYRIVVSRFGMALAIIPGLPLAYFYGICLNRFSFAPAPGSYPETLAFVLYILAAATTCIGIMYVIGKYFSRLLHVDSTAFLHVDQFISRGIEIFNSIPRIVLIITLSAISRPSVWTLVLIIGFTSWTEIARLVRGEMLKVRESEFMQSAEASGIKITRQIFRHALPNIIIPALTAITLGVASAILTESALSFLGVGVPADVVTWGSLLNEGRQNFSAWWLVVFPGLAIFITVTAINILGDGLSEMLNAQNK